MKLGVNIDHVATLRQARKETFPSPVAIALLAEKAGANNITCHLREDRRHIQDEDVWLLKEKIQTELNFEMAATEEMIAFALKLKPAIVTVVPEKREELTTEGGLNLFSNEKKFYSLCQRFQQNNIAVSFFVEPDPTIIQKAKDLGAQAIEIHTGQYAYAKNDVQKTVLKNIQASASLARKLGLEVHAGHGLDLRNLEPLSQIKEIESFQIGYAIIAEALIYGIEHVIAQYKKILIT